MGATVSIKHPVLSVIVVPLSDVPGGDGGSSMPSTIAEALRMVFTEDAVK